METSAKKFALHVNLAPDVAQALQNLVKRHDSSYTEEVRLAISAWKWINDQAKAKNKILVQDKSGGAPREIRFLHGIESDESDT